MLAACAYRGELLGLLAIHLILILLSINKVDQELQGSAHILSHCLGALKKVKDLPPHCVPTRCKTLRYSKDYSDPLHLESCKNIGYWQFELAHVANLYDGTMMMLDS
jgi:hypothetical protein